jgi:hypothetical protein
VDSNINAKTRRWVATKKGKGWLKTKNFENGNKQMQGRQMKA